MKMKIQQAIELNDALYEELMRKKRELTILLESHDHSLHKRAKLSRQINSAMGEKLKEFDPETYLQ